MDLGSAIQIAGGVGLMLGGTAVLADAALRPQSQLFGRTLIAGNNPNEVAFTYDDGPNDAATPELLDLFARYDTKATFFMIGKFVRERPEIARAVLAAGHLIGNHTMTHPWLTNKSATLIREELRACNEALEDVLGAPVRYFRPPHGARRPVVMRAAHELGMKTVQWNAMGYDWEPIGAEKIVSNIDDGLRSCQRRSLGANILLHDGFDKYMGADRNPTIAATESLLERFKREGKRVVTVDAWG